MANSENLEGVQCPDCKSEGPFNIAASAWFSVHDDGTAEHWDVEWDDNSMCQCSCGKNGPLRDFKTGSSTEDGTIESQPTQRERDVIEAMTKGGTFAQVWWTTEEILVRAADLNIDMSEETAEKILRGVENDIASAMTRAGLDVIIDAVWNVASAEKN